MKQDGSGRRGPVVREGAGLIDLIAALERKTDYQVFPVQINNAQYATTCQTQGIR